MLKKRLNIKGLRKKVLKLEYEKKLMCQIIGVETKNNSHAHGNYRILILRNAPIDERGIQGSNLVKASLEKVSAGNFLTPLELAQYQSSKVLNKCVKKNILKKIVNANAFESKWLQCKYVYWMTPDATSLKEQLCQLNLLKTYVRAEPKDAFLGCLLESRLTNKKGSEVSSVINYQYYYPSQITQLCDAMDKAAGGASKATGLEIVGQLIQTIESSINSMSMILALKTKHLEGTISA